MSEKMEFLRLTVHVGFEGQSAIRRKETSKEMAPYQMKFVAYGAGISE
jgi:hypothetical protein